MNVLGRKVDRMTHQVTAKSNIDFGATGVDEILQNVAYILSTFVMSYPDKRERDRKKELEVPFLFAKRRNTARIIDSIQRFEPRAVIIDVDYVGDVSKGKIEPIVKVIVNG